MDYRVMSPAATVEKLGLQCAAWQATKLVQGVRTETLTSPVAGVGFSFLKRTFLRHSSLVNDKSLYSRLWLEDSRGLRRDKNEVSRDYCAVVHPDSQEVRVWVVIVQMAPDVQQPELRKFSVTCLWFENPLDGCERTRSVALTEEMVRLYIDQSYVRKSRMPGIPIGSEQYAPVFSDDAPITFSWPQVDEVRS